MSYLVLARKWRPQTFRDLIGQEHVSQTLQNAIQSGRVAHAFLFTGARGVGKTSSARILAKTLTCEQGPTIEPCNQCPACQEITAGTSVDVFEIDGASNTSVDDIRELRENIKYLPSRLRYKIFIIDEVHMLSTSAFNALLKTLEEPPPHVKFIFATTEPHKVPITILSRCQRFDFRRIPMQMLVDRLRYIVDQEGVAISDAALAVIARKGDGSMRDSLSILDQVLAFCGESANDDEVAALLGVVDRRLLLEAAGAVVTRDTAKVLDAVRRVDAVGYNMRQFCQELVDQFRTILVVRTVPAPAGLLEVSDSELSDARQLAGEVSQEDLQRYLTILIRADQEMAQSPFARLILEMALVRMATLAPVVPVEELLERLNALSLRPAAGVAADPPRWEKSPPRPAMLSAAVRPAESQPQKSREPAPASRSASQAAGPEGVAPPGAAAAGPSPVAGDWEGLVAFVRQRRAGLGSILEHGSPLQVSAARLELGFPAGSFYLTRLQDPESITLLRELAGEYFRATPEVRVVPLSPGGGDPPQTLFEKKKREESEQVALLEQEARSNPLVKAALDIFGGSIEEIVKK